MKYKDLLKLVLDLHIGTLAITQEEQEKYLQYAITIVRDVYNTLAPLADWSTIINSCSLEEDSYLSEEPVQIGGYYCATCSVMPSFTTPKLTVLATKKVWGEDGEYYTKIDKKDMMRLQKKQEQNIEYNCYCNNGGSTISIYHLYTKSPQLLYIECVPDFDQTTLITIENNVTTSAILPNTESFPQEVRKRGAIVTFDTEIPLPSECIDILINGLLYMVYKDMPAAVNRNNEEIAYSRYQLGKKQLFNSYWYRQNNNWGG